jgi:hypothetical protein
MMDTSEMQQVKSVHRHTFIQQMNFLCKVRILCLQHLDNNCNYVCGRACKSAWRGDIIAVGFL